MKHLLKLALALVAFGGIVMLIGSIGSVDIDAMSLREAGKYILIAIAMLGVSFVGAALTEILPERKS